MNRTVHSSSRKKLVNLGMVEHACSMDVAIKFKKKKTKKQPFPFS